MLDYVLAIEFIAGFIQATDPLQAVQNAAPESNWRLALGLFGAAGALLVPLVGMMEQLNKLIASRKEKRTRQRGGSQVQLWKYIDQNEAERGKKRSKWGLLGFGLYFWISPIVFFYAFFILELPPILSVPYLDIAFLVYILLLATFSYPAGFYFFWGFLKLRKLRGTEREKARCRAEIYVRSDCDSAMTECQRALRLLNVKFIEIDVDEGLIRAKKNYRWLPALDWYGFVIEFRVRLKELKENMYSIVIEAEGIRPTVRADKERNAGYVERFIKVFVN